MPNLVVTAGPNGAGKTTTAKELLADGGHNIPEDVIRRRYERSLHNFFNDYTLFADAWIMIDNSHEEGPSRIAEYGDTGLRVYDESLWQDLARRYMKPPHEAREETVIRERGFTNQEIYEAARRGVAKAVARHKALGQSIVVWRDGHVVTLKPEEIEI